MRSRVKLIEGDSYEVLKSIPDKSIDLIVVDPPYNLTGVKGAGSLWSKRGVGAHYKDIKGLDMNHGYDIEKYTKEFMRIMRDGVNIYFWCNKRQIPKYFEIYVGRYKCTFDILCWHKTNAMPTYSNKYLSDTEYLLYFRKGKKKCIPEAYNDARTYYLAPINIQDKKKYKHPTIKPLDITERIIRNSSNEDSIVLDPFMGSGTTGVACVRLGRPFIGIEINKEYYDIAKERIESMSQSI